MTEQALFFAFGCACVAALMGNRAAYPLLASAVLSFWLRKSGVEFNLPGWLMIDALVIATIARRNMPWMDWAIIGLFVPAWVGYAIGDPWRFQTADWVVFTQFLLTIPFLKLQSIGGSVTHGPLREVKYEGAR